MQSKFKHLRSTKDINSLGNSSIAVNERSRCCNDTNLEISDGNSLKYALYERFRTLREG